MRDIKTGKFKKTHAMCGTSEYNSWTSMKKRCINPDKDHERYRGMYIDPRWIESFENFMIDMGLKPSNKHTIDRIDNSKGYYKENCRWATQKEQNRNYSQNRILEHNGIKKSITEWAEHLGIDRFLIYGRLQKGWSSERALTVPKHASRFRNNEAYRRGYSTRR